MPINMPVKISTGRLVWAGTVGSEGLPSSLSDAVMGGSDGEGLRGLARLGSRLAHEESDVAPSHWPSAYRVPSLSSKSAHQPKCCWAGGSGNFTPRALSSAYVVSMSAQSKNRSECGNESGALRRGSSG